jgi:cardiolipin synthase A/B
MHTPSMQHLPLWRALPVALASALALAAGACSVLPVREGTAATRAAGGPQAARRADVHGSHGRLTPQARRKVLDGVAAEGGAASLARHLAVLTAATGLPLLAANEARLLVDGPATFDAMFSAIEAARKTVFLESYIIEDESVALHLAELLIRKQAQGVATYVMYDAVGSIRTEARYFDTLRSHGVAVCEFNPVNPAKRVGYWDITRRDHRKILVVDGRVAFTGGINISAVYSSGSMSRRSAAKVADDDANGWRDTQIRLRGPAVTALDELVRSVWTAQGCEGGLPPAAPKQRPAGDRLVQIIPSGPGDGDNRIYGALLSAIDASTRSVHLSMAYFAPGPDMVAALCDAAARGVDVSLILPSVSDFSPVLYAGRSYYTQLLESGVRIHELRGAVLHAKTAVIDGVWSTVGSSNMDWRSFTDNNEVNAVVLGEDFGREMEQVFRRDIAASSPVTAEAWAHRPLAARAREWFARLLERLW